MPDMTDDWMSPKTSELYTHRTPQRGDPVRYLIERQRRIPTFGDPIHQWDQWSSHDTAEKRDAELSKLRKEHPVWRLRARDHDPYMEEVMRTVRY